MSGLNEKTQPLFPMLKSRQEMIMAGARLSQILGHPKSVGQIYGYVFLAPKPQSLDDIAGELGLSKASISNGMRQLLTWGVVRQVWVQGDRKEFFEAIGDVSTLFKAGYSDFLKPKVTSSRRRVVEIQEYLEQEHGQGDIDQEQYEFAKKRLEKLLKVQSRFEKLLPLVERLTRR